MKKIMTDGIYYLSPVGGSHDWYWGMDYTSGDLYEAEELYKTKHLVNRNRAIFVHYPDGTIIEPVITKEGQYLGQPTISNENRICQLLVDFAKKEIMILCFNPVMIEQGGKVQTLAILPLSIVKDCYNLLLKTDPIILTRQSDNRFQLLWSETHGRTSIDFPIEATEAFTYMKEERLFFNSWWEKEGPEYEYHENVIIRDLNGEIIEKCEGGIFEVYPGQYWILQ